MFSRENNYSQLTPFKYMDCLSDLNGKYLSEIRATLEPISNFLNDYHACAVVVGSDGKKEKGVKSGTEIVYIQDEQSNKKLFSQSLVDEFEKTSQLKYSDIFFVDKNSLPRVLKNNEDILSFVDKNSKIIYPDRILNSILICGQQLIHNKARQNVLIEME